MRSDVRLGGRDSVFSTFDLGRWTLDQSSKTALVLMARYPVAGAVKTRLAEAIGAGRAAALYHAFIRDIDARFQAGRRTLVWAFTPPQADFAGLVSPGTRCLPQRGAHLGERMRQCFLTLFASGFERVLMIGADVPHVSDEQLDEAEQRLDSADVVLGPAQDGGYYLVAMRHPHDLFSGVHMGTATVLAETLAKLNAAGLRAHLLPASFDIDAADDLGRLHALLRRDQVRLPHTAALLARWEDEDDTRRSTH